VIRCRAITHDNFVDEEYNQQNVTKTLSSADLFLKIVNLTNILQKVVFVTVYCLLFQF